MTDISTIARRVVDALNGRDFAALAGLAHEDVAISGIGGGMDNGREALRERFARHFQATDESYGDVLVLSDGGDSHAAVRVTARGKGAGGAAASGERVLLLDLEDGRITRIGLFAPAQS